MAAIVGLIDPLLGPVEREDRVCRMIEVQRHRGPDAQGWRSEGEASIGASVLAVTRGTPRPQPASVALPGGRRVFAAIDGALHNRPELRAELSTLGLPLADTGDAELVALAFGTWGIDAVRHLEGAFGLCVWDPDTHRLFLARDKLGLKPLYYLDERGRFAFSSLQRGLLALGRRNPGLDGIAELFLHGAAFAAGHMLDDRACFEGISSLRPGHALRWSPGGVGRERYWALEDESTEPWESREACIEAQEEAFVHAVRRTTDGVERLGSMLSGGVDSSLTTAEAWSRHDGVFVSSCVSYSPSHDDPDPEAAAIVSAHLNALRSGSHRLAFGETWMPSMLDDLDAMVRAADEPQWDTRQIGMFRNYRTLRHADCAAVTTGDPASQLAFGNYPRFLGWRPEPMPIENIHDFAALWRSRLGWFHALFEPAYANGLLARDRPDALIDEALDVHMAPWWRTPEDRVHAVGMWVLQTFAYSLFVTNDRLGMAHSVEARHPYANERMFRLALRTPLAWNLEDPEIGCGKAVIRQLGRTRLPPEIWRDRRGKPFPAPIRVSSHLAVADRLEQEIPLAPRSVWDIVDRGLVTRMVDDFRTHASEVARETPDGGESVTIFSSKLPVRTVHLFSVLNLLRWFHIYFA